MKVQNFESRNGNKVANQFLINDGGKEIFQSYNSVIAIKHNGKVTLDEKYWNYSRTTAKYRIEFLGETTKVTQSKIDSGEYKLANLN